MPGEILLDLAMSRHGLAIPGLGVLVPIVTRTMPQQDASPSRQLLEKFGAFHQTSSFATRRTEGMCPLVSSA